MPLSRWSFALVAGLTVACDAPKSDPGPAPSPTPAVHPVPSGAMTPGAESVDALRDAARTLVGQTVVGGHALATLGELTDTFGPRLTGSDEHRRAAAWAVTRLQAAGLDATTEPFTLARSWTRGEAQARVVSPSGMPLHVASLGWTGGATSVRGEVVKLDDVTEEAITKRKADLKGKIALFERATYRKARGAHPLSRLEAAGVAGVLVVSSRTANVLGTGACQGPKGAACTGPALMIGLEDGEAIGRMLEKGAVTVELSTTAAFGGPVEVPNVVAELKGREKPAEVVLVGAHLDSWDFATGAQDNGSGAAQVLEAARVLRGLPSPPRRTVRFILWGGEEQGLLGSRAYVASHAADLDRFVAYLNTDHGAGTPKGWNLDGRSDVVLAMKPIAKRLLAGLAATSLDTELECDTDHCPFWVQGVPTLNLEVDGSKYEEVHHLGSDTLDKVTEGALDLGAAVLAVTAYAIAELPDRLAPRADHAAIAKVLKGQTLTPMLVDEGMWKP